MGTMTKLTRKQAIEEARKHLQTHAVNGETAFIYTWPRTKATNVGVRVAEVGWSTGMGGAVYMQSDPDGLAVCAAVERLIIELLNGDDREDGDDSEVNRQIYLLDFLIKNEA